ncbi:MAG TPA: tripartite tricarboxylate transporter substrate binding protein [Roseococcus sp.]|jgi:tripartite-type tricarboxylate transporter receptor subunit TctC|nr:tripartite tricarboxylate transporter substrate binding protein [Roseococcus sp.]
MTRHLTGRRALLAGAAAMVPLQARAALPDRPVRIVVGFGAGTGPDLLARMVADALKDSLPAGVIVDNRSGAGGVIAAQEVARVRGEDGTTLMLGGVGPLTMGPSIFASLPYDPGRDFASIAFLAALDFALVVPNSVPVEDFAGYLRWAASQPQLPMGTFGAGTPGHFGAAIMGVTSRLPVEAVHFRTTGDAMTALLNGTTKGLFGTIALVAPHVQAGRLRALAVTGPERSRVLPEVPTMGELGRQDLVFNSRFGLVAPSGTPPATLAALEAAVLRVMDTPEMAARLEQRGFRPSPLGRARFDTLRREETARWAEVVRMTRFQALD